MAWAYSYGTTTGQADLFNIIDTFLQGRGWSRLVNDSSYRVYSSTGENSDRQLYVRITILSGSDLALTAYRYWSGTTGYSPTPSNTTTACIYVPASASILYFLYGDKDCFYCVTRTTTGFHCFGGFSSGTSYWNTAYATTTSAVSAGSNVTIPVDNTSIFAVNNSYQFANFNHADGNGEWVTVTDINPGVSITVSSLANAHAAGGIIGECVMTNLVLSYTGASVYVWRRDGASTSMAANINLNYPQHLSPEQRYNRFWLWDIPITTSTTYRDILGPIKNVYQTGISNIADQDTITVGSEVYKYFYGKNASGTSTWYGLAIKES